MGDFGMTMPPVPPLLIDPLVTAMMQKGSSDVPVSQPRSTSPAFLVSLWVVCLYVPCAALRCAMLCCAVLCCAVLCCAVLCCQGVPLYC